MSETKQNKSVEDNMPINDGHIGMLERVIKLINKYGLFRVFQALCVIGVFIYLIYNAHNVGSSLQGIVRTEIDAHTEKLEKEHTNALEIRQRIKPKIDKILSETMNNLDADRIFVMEMHNGNNNTSGLPFVYGEMTYEQVRGHITHIDDDYINLNLSRFSFPLYLEKERIWQGSIEELDKIDDKLAKRLSSNDVTYFAIMHIYGVSNLIGYCGVSYCNGKQPKSNKDIVSQLTATTQQLAIMLDANRENNGKEIKSDL